MPEVTIVRREDGRHEAHIDGQLVARLSSYAGAHRGGKHVTSWRVVTPDRRVDISGLLPGDRHVNRNIEILRSAALRIWNNQQPEVIAAARVARHAARLEFARSRVELYERMLAQAKQTLVELEKAEMS